MEISNLSDTRFKTLVIRMLKELIGYFNSIKKTKGEMKVTLCEIKKNLQGINSEGKEAKNQINNLQGRKKYSIRTRRKNNQKEQGQARSLWDNFKRSNICIIGVPGKEKEEEIENLFEKIMKENFPNLVKEIDI